MPLFLIAIFIMVVFVYFISVFFIEFSLAEKLIAYFISVSSNIIVTLEIASLFNQLDKPLIILLIQLIINIFIFLILRKKFFLPKFTAFKKTAGEYFRSGIDFVVKHTFLTLFLGLIFAIYGFLFFVSLRFPQNTTDVLYNHLSRIGYWLQQSSLKPYHGFNNIGVTYPYNNSLLMLWSIVFIRNDSLVGLVQLISTISSALTIYCIAVDLGFPKRNSLISALLFLTFPIILLQSITAQNDLLAAAFISAAFLFFLKSLKKNPGVFLILSSLSFSLALGTKQYAVFALPGYILLTVVGFFRSKENRRNKITDWASLFIIFTLLVGSYTYIQNEVYFGSFFGESNVVDYEINGDTLNQFVPKAAINSARLFSQFISCEGLPQIMELEQKCINTKAAFLKPLFANQTFNIEKEVFLLEAGNTFNLSGNNSMNEESAWFGFLSWILLLPALIYGIITSVKRKNFEGIILIITAITFSIFISSFKFGWDPYMGRYLITPVILLMPFTAFIFNQNRAFNKLFLVLLCSSSIFIATYAVANNDSRPLISKALFNRENWDGYSTNQQNVFKILRRLSVHEKDLWGESPVYIKTYADHKFTEPLAAVESLTPVGTTLGIVAKEGYFPDYLFFGNTFNRKIIAIKNGEDISSDNFSKIKYFLISPDFSDYKPAHFDQLFNYDGWRVLEKN